VPQSFELNLSRVITADPWQGSDGNQPLVIISVAYHSHSALKNLAEDLANQKGSQFDWLIVNNAPLSAPLDAEQLPSANYPIQIINGQEGDGFGRGCNRAFEVLRAQGFKGWVWLLNPDTNLRRSDECARMIYQLTQVDKCTVLGTAVMAADGKLEASGGWLDPVLQFRRRRVGEKLIKKEKTIAVDWVSGCSLVLQPTAHQPEARFDQSFILYYEDFDLCLRLKAQGAEVLWWPELIINHQKGAGSKTPSARRLKLSTISYLRFIKRYCPLWVQLLRIGRVFFNTVLRFPLQPKSSLSVLSALWEHLSFQNWR
jgi:GT2 family glycosyltransferase